MLSKFIGSLAKKFGYFVADNKESATIQPLLVAESFELGRRVGAFDKNPSDDYFDIQEGLYNLIDTNQFDINAFMKGTKSVLGYEYELGESDIFRIGQRKLQQFSSASSMTPENNL